jgi:prevent-host-death family protein
MTERQTTTISTAELRENLSEMLNVVIYQGDRIEITRHGKSVAAIVPIDDLERLERLDKKRAARCRD